MSKVRIVYWNDNGNFVINYRHIIREYKADIVILSGCSNPVFNPSYEPLLSNYLWTGQENGMGIFVRNGYKIESLHWPAENHKFYINARVNDCLTLLIAYPEKPFVSGFMEYLKLNDKRIDKNTILIGTLNSNPVLDIIHKRTSHPHMEMVNFLKEKGLASAYHHITGENHGEEKTPTCFFDFDERFPFHLDYCFIDPSRLISFKIDTSDKIMKYRGHAPLVIDIEDGNKPPVKEEAVYQLLPCSDLTLDEFIHLFQNAESEVERENLAKKYCTPFEKTIVANYAKFTTYKTKYGFFRNKSGTIICLPYYKGNDENGSCEFTTFYGDEITIGPPEDCPSEFE